MYGETWGVNDTSPELDPWVALSSDGGVAEDMFFNSATPGQVHIQQLHGAHAMMRGGGVGARANAWGSELLEFNSGLYGGFDTDYLSPADATPDNASWLPTTYLPGMHSVSPLPGAQSQMLVLA
jgi:hypothetical protein